MNPYEMVAFIVVVSVIGSVLRAAFQGRQRRFDRERDLPVARDDGETARLRDEVKQLRERLHVLERITVEKENSLEREIERLRDRP